MKSAWSVKNRKLDIMLVLIGVLLLSTVMIHMSDLLHVSWLNRKTKRNRAVMVVMERCRG